MLNDDRAAQKAEELLPWTVEQLSAILHEIYQKEAHRRGDVRHPDHYNDLSEATKEWDRILARWILDLRPAVAVELREAYAEIERLRAALQKAAGFKVDRCACVFIDDEPTLECAYHKTLRAELASIEQFAESWPCHCAENYPGATMYHGHDCQTAIAIEFVAQWRAAKVKP